MHVLVRASLIATSFAFLVPSSATAKLIMPSASWSGTWSLNVASSKLSAPAGKRSETRVYVVKGNKLSVKATGTDNAGKPVKYSYSGAFDGRPYPMIGNPVGDSIVLTLVNPLKANIMVKKGKIVTATATSDVSPDGKHLILTRKTLRANAAPMIDVLDFDKK